MSIAAVVVHCSYHEAVEVEDRGHSLLGEVGIVIEGLDVSCSPGCSCCYLSVCYAV